VQRLTSEIDVEDEDPVEEMFGRETKIEEVRSAMIDLEWDPEDVTATLPSQQELFPPETLVEILNQDDTEKMFVNENEKTKFEWLELYQRQHELLEIEHDSLFTIKFVDVLKKKESADIPSLSFIDRNMPPMPDYTLEDF